MAIHRPISGNPIVNGRATITPTDIPSASTYGVNTAFSSSLASGDQTTWAKVTDGRFRSGSWEQGPPAQSASDINTSTSGTGAVVYYAARENCTHEIQKMDWSYSATPGSGTIRVESPSGTVIWGPQFVTAAGPGFHCFNPDGLRGVRGSDMLIELSRGGGTVSGTLSVVGHKVV